MQRPQIDRPGRASFHPAPHRPGSVHRGLILLLAALLAMLAAGFAYLSWRDHATALDRGWQVAERGAMGAAEHMRRTLSVARLVTLAVEQDIRRNGLARLQGEGWEDLHALAGQTPEVTALWIADADGTLVAGSTARATPPANWSGRPFFAPLRDGAADYLMPLTWGVLTRNWYLSYSVPVRDAAGRFLGIVQSALFTDDVGRAYAELDLPRGASAGVFRATDGAPLILWPVPPPADRSMPAPIPPAAAAILRAAQEGQAEGQVAGRLTLETPEGPAVAAWRRIEEGEPMIAAMVMPRAEVLAPFRDRLARNASVLLLSAIPLAALGFATLRAQRQAARSEARFRGTFEQAAVGVAHVALDGRWLGANATLCEMLGYTEAQLRGRTVDETTHPEDRPATQEMSRRLIAGEIATFSLRKRYLRRDGTVLHGELTASLLHDEATGRPLYGVAVIQDISARLEAEAARALSERRLSLACAAVGLGVFDVDTSTGLAVVNPEWRAIYGLPPSDAPVTIEERWAVAHPDDAARIRARTQEAYATGTGYDEEFRILRRDTGELRWIASRGAFVDDGPQPRRLLGVIQDITARREAEAARAASEQRLALASEAAGMGVFDVDAPTGLAVVTAQWRRLYGLPPGEDRVPFEARMELVLEEDRPEVRAAVQQAHRTGMPYAAEFRIRRRDSGEIRWLATRGSYVGDAMPPVRFLGVTYDITARKQAEAARAASDERLAMASVAAGIGVWDVDTATGDAEVNDEYRRLYFLPPGSGKLTMRARLVHVHPDDRPKLRDHRILTAPEGGPFSDEFRVIHPVSGEIRWIASRGSSVGQGGGAGRRIVGVSYDITERKREQEREMLLAREVDHRARNVLAVVRSIVKLTRADDPRQFAEAVEGRVAALARAHTLLARDRWTGTGLADIVQEELAAYGTDGRVALDGPALRLRPDVVQPLSMVLHELATNAAKYGALSTPQGRLSVTWQLAHPEGEGARLVLSWQERGGPPLSGPPARRGFGTLVVEATVRSQLGGTVALDWSGPGLRCTIALPAGQALAEAPPEAPGESRPPPAAEAQPAVRAFPALAGRRILVVEDEPLVALELATALEEAGCEVVGPAATLADALALAGAHAARLDAGVLDANLHGHSSRPVAELLAGRGVKVIYVTGYSSLPAGVGEGVTLLSKPLRDGDLLAALDRVLAPAPA